MAASVSAWGYTIVQSHPGETCTPPQALLITPLGGNDMWRKDAKPNTQSSNVPEPVATTPKPAQTSSNTNMTNPAPATSAAPTNISHTSTAAPIPAAAPSVASSVPAANPVAPAAPRVNSASVIGAGLKIQGEITGDSDLVVEGEAHGRIRMVNGRVTVAANGHVNADIEAIEISVDGNVQG